MWAPINQGVVPKNRNHVSHGRIWQLWHDGDGRWTIEYWDRDRSHRTLARIHCLVRWDRDTKRSHRVYICRDWDNGFKYGEHKSAFGAFQAFTKGA